MIIVITLEKHWQNYMQWQAQTCIDNFFLRLRDAYFYDFV